MKCVSITAISKIFLKLNIKSIEYGVLCWKKLVKNDFNGFNKRYIGEQRLHIKANHIGVTILLKYFRNKFGRVLKCKLVDRDVIEKGY